jgi:hypothetical protein
MLFCCTSGALLIYILPAVVVNRNVAKYEYKKLSLTTKSELSKGLRRFSKKISAL